MRVRSSPAANCPRALPGDVGRAYASAASRSRVATAERSARPPIRQAPRRHRAEEPRPHQSSPGQASGHEPRPHPLVSTRARPPQRTARPCTRSRPNRGRLLVSAMPCHGLIHGFQEGAARDISEDPWCRRPADRQTGSVRDCPVQHLPEARLGCWVHVHGRRHTWSAVGIDLEVSTCGT